MISVGPLLPFLLFRITSYYTTVNANDRWMSFMRRFHVWCSMIMDMVSWRLRHWYFASQLVWSTFFLDTGRWNLRWVGRFPQRSLWQLIVIHSTNQRPKKLKVQVGKNKMTVLDKDLIGSRVDLWLMQWTPLVWDEMQKADQERGRERER